MTLSSTTSRRQHRDNNNNNVKLIEKTTISDCPFLAGYWQASKDTPWTKKPLTGFTKNDDDVAGTYLDESVVVRLQSSSSSSSSRKPPFRWNKETNFHPDLKADDRDGLVVQFQAKARDSIMILLSTQPNFDRKDHHLKYEIILGGAGNTTTIIRKVVQQERDDDNNNKSKKSDTDTQGSKQQRRKYGVSVSVPSRVCRTDSWVSYWVCLCKGNVYVGIGVQPGKGCIGVLEDSKAEGGQKEFQGSEDHDGHTHTDGGGDGSSVSDGTQQQKVVGDGDGMDTKSEIHSTDEAPSMIKYVGIGNGSNHTILLQHILLTTLPSVLERTLSDLPPQDELDIRVVPSPNNGDGIDTETAEWRVLMEEYKKECATRKARAARYGTEYSEPPMDAFLPWSKAKRLRENHDKGFITGLDVMDPKEVAKQEARKARFADAAWGSGPQPGNNDEGDGSQSPNRFGATAATAATDTTLGSSSSSKPDLAIEQAWDKEVLTRPFRTDPPKYLWRKGNNPHGSVDGVKQPDRDESIMEESDPFAMEKPKLATLVPEKVHVFAIDWAAFKQIRNNDVMAHFASYGPSYVEWLGDLSCNVCFEDQYTASRALFKLSNEIPSPPPDGVSNTQSDNVDYKDGATTADPPPDLGRMTWRLGKQAIRKMVNDRHGRRGTTARILMRPATSQDILQDRPTSWPAPPGGFSSTMVLGPHSDYAPRKKQQQQQLQQPRESKSKKRNSRREKSEGRDRHELHHRMDHESAESLMNRGLSSGRDGFSIEEMEKERAKKRQKS